MEFKLYIINFGKKIGLQEDLFGNGFINTIMLEEKIITDLRLKTNQQKPF